MLSTVNDFISQLFVDFDSLEAVFKWVLDLPRAFGSMHPVLQLAFGLFGTFLALKILIQLL